jgi:hypothetical protein
MLCWSGIAVVCAAVFGVVSDRVAFTLWCCISRCPWQWRCFCSFRGSRCCSKLDCSPVALRTAGLAIATSYRSCRRARSLGAVGPGVQESRFSLFPPPLRVTKTPGAPIDVGKPDGPAYPTRNAAAADMDRLVNVSTALCVPHSGLQPACSRQRAWCAVDRVAAIAFPANADLSAVR